MYSTSHIFSGRRDPQRDRDLDGIHLVEIPWLTGAGGQHAGDGRRTPASISWSPADLHALGADAFLLNWRLAQLRESANPFAATPGC